MALYTKIALKNFNVSLVMESLRATYGTVPDGVTPVIASVGFAGFDRLDERVRTPKAIRTEVGYSSNTGADFADPGELRISTSRDLTQAEEISLDAVLLSHVSTSLTAEQVRQDQDEADWTQMIADFPNWDTANTVQRMNMLKRAIRLIIRKERATAI